MPILCLVIVWPEEIQTLQIHGELQILSCFWKTGPTDYDHISFSEQVWQVLYISLSHYSNREQYVQGTPLRKSKATSYNKWSYGGMFVSEAPSEQFAITCVSLSVCRVQHSGTELANLWEKHNWSLIKFRMEWKACAAEQRCTNC